MLDSCHLIGFHGAVDSQSRVSRLKTTGWHQGRLSLSFFQSRSNEYQDWDRWITFIKEDHKVVVFSPNSTSQVFACSFWELKCESCSLNLKVKLYIVCSVFLSPFLYMADMILSDGNGIWTHYHLLRKWTLSVECWVFVDELSGCWIESPCCQ